ncbi:hypothetical protein [Rhizobium sp. CC-YZS058]|uniref:hypothetical protein n=1 Tax=Rhizobium sp. CC-YZS058 TaxID=3042153 RepID=UPI002B05F11C|nr:hypothetical protein [Rhizobium sp. CC-YZS058]MEA3533224.1 hypothetical protein [Rhizobium sp. CC-YZS058]
MREFSKVSPKVWRNKQFRALPTNDAQLVFLYFLTCDHQNSAGSYCVPDGYAAADLNWTITRYVEARNLVVQAGLIVFDEDTDELFISGWFSKNPSMNPKHARSIEAAIAKIDSGVVREAAEEGFQRSEELKEARASKSGGGNVLEMMDRLASSNYMTRGRS